MFHPSVKKERVLLVIVDFKNNVHWSREDMFEEMKELVIASGGEVVDKIICPIDKPHAGTLAGEGKVKEIAAACAAGNIDTVIFSADLKGSQQRNLEEEIKTKTLDRTQLILHIFAHRATSQEGKMQVELAQLEYLLPRLVGKGIELSRLGGGIGTLGPGETKLEVDRRRISQRIAKLRDDLKEVEADRAVKRKKRKDQNIPLVSLVGYTNAGKSTLLNALTDAGQETRDGLFTTLDPLSRQMTLPNHQKIVLSDTVGFMHDLPHHLIEAFKATLEEVHQSDLLLHVVDVGNPRFQQLFESVRDVLSQLKSFNKPTVVVLNKTDKVDNPELVAAIGQLYENSVGISALQKENLDGLQDKIVEMLSSLVIEVSATIPIGRMDLVNMAHKEGQVYSIKYYNDTIFIHAGLPPKFAGMLQKAALPV